MSHAVLYLLMLRIDNIEQVVQSECALQSRKRRIMDAMVTEAMARSQLELLYKLGLLSDDPEEENEDPHAFLNQLPPPTASEAALESQTRATIVKPATEEIRPSLPDIKASARLPDSPAVSNHAVIWPATLGLATHTHSLESPIPVTRGLERSDRKPLAELEILSTCYPEKLTFCNNNEDVMLKRDWFRRWQFLVKSQRRLDEARSYGQTSLQRRSFRRWWWFVRQSRRSQVLAHQIIQWRRMHAICQWRSWSIQQQRINSLLTSEELSRALGNRLRRTSAWQRWQAFVLWGKRRHRQKENASNMYNHCLLRKAWLSLRVQQFQNRHRLRTLHTCFRRLHDRRSHRALSEKVLVYHRYQHVRGRKKELFRRWWHFIDRRKQERRRVWRIQMILARGKYLDLWRTTAAYARRIAALRSHVQRRNRLAHLRAWHTATSALKMSRNSSFWHTRQIKSQYFRLWHRWAGNSARLHTATLIIQRLKQARALRDFQATTRCLRRGFMTQNMARDYDRKRLLRLVWVSGWRVFHEIKQAEAVKLRRVYAITEIKAFKVWRSIWNVRQSRRNTEAAIMKVATTINTRWHWVLWHHFLECRQSHRRSLETAEAHYRCRLVLMGLVGLSRKVDRRSRQKSSYLLLRSTQRQRLKRNILYAWKRIVQTKRSHELKIRDFQARPRFCSSELNCTRRYWNQWRRGVWLRICIQEFHEKRSLRNMQRVFDGWIHHLTLQLKAAELLRKKTSFLVEVAFSHWKSYALLQRTKRELSRKAMYLLQQTLSIRLFRRWKSYVCEYRRRIRHAQSVLLARTQHKTQIHVFQQWRLKLVLSQRVHSICEKRRLGWLEDFFVTWRHVASRRAKTRRKLQYFWKTCGGYPSTSLFRRAWEFWKSWSSQRHAAWGMHQRVEVRVMATCFGTWRTFRLARLSLRSWQQVSLISAASSGDLGKRRRQLRERIKCHLMGRMFSVWAEDHHRRREVREQLAAGRRQLLADIRHAYLNGCIARDGRKRMWFRRWQKSIRLESRLADRFYAFRTFKRFLLAWWRYMIHSKQEQVLLDARRTMSQLSFYHPRQHEYQAQMPMAKHEDKLKGHSARKPETEGRNQEAMIRRRRMLDPESQKGYSTAGIQKSEKADARSNYPTSQRIHARPREESAMSRDAREDMAPHTKEKAESNQHGWVTVVETPRMEQRRQPQTTAVELPLFDTDTRTEYVEEARRSHSSEANKRQRAESSSKCRVSMDMTLENVAAMDVHSGGSATSADRGDSPAISLSKRDESPILGSSWIVLDSSPQSQITRTVRHGEMQYDAQPLSHSSYQTRLKSALKKKKTTPGLERLPPGSSEADAPLTQLLQLPQPSRSTQVLTQDERAERGAQESYKNSVHPEQLVDDVLKHYLTRLRGISSEKDDGCADEFHWERVCFVLLRDLGLFSNGYFVIAFENTLKSTVVDVIKTVSETPRVLMKAFLVQFIENLPSYQTHRSQQRGRSMSPLDWLALTHIPAHIGSQPSTKGISNQLMWVRSQLPSELETSLPKLLKCIKKYRPVLEEFFTWRPTTQETTTSELMDTAQFLQLMKHLRTFPQLFNRRELETAVGLSGSQHHLPTNSSITLTFPQFVETLLRCALKLQWTELQEKASEDQQTAEVVVVVKFLMLIFAMEGRGSVLSKRNQDLKLIISFLEEQQAHKKAEKHQRFRQMLRSQQKVRQVVRHRTSRHGSAQAQEYVPALHRFLPPEQAMDCEQRIESDQVLETKPFQKSEKRRQMQNLNERPDHIVTRRSHDSPYEGGSSSLASEGREGASVDLSVMASPPPTQSLPSEKPFERKADHPSGADVSTLETHQSRRNWSHPSLMTEEKPRTRSNTLMATHTSDVESGESSRKNMFLDDILSSIGDVEYLLQQSDSRIATRTSKQGSAIDDTSSLTDSRRLFQSDVRPYNLTEVGEDDVVDHIRVSDPMLDCLTEVDRFTESPDWESRLSLVDLAEHGIYAMFPSSMSCVGSIQDLELNELTHPSTVRCIDTMEISNVADTSSS